MCLNSCPWLEYNARQLLICFSKTNRYLLTPIFFKPLQKNLYGLKNLYKIKNPV